MSGKTLDTISTQRDPDRLGTAVWIYDFDRFRVIRANRATLKLLRAESFEELYARDLAADMSEAVQARIEDYRRRIGNNETIVETWTFYPRGQPQPARCRCKAIALDDGRTGMLIKARAVPESIDAPTLRSLEALRHTAVPISVYDENGDLLVANPAALHILPENRTLAARFVVSEDYEQLSDQLRKHGRCTLETRVRTRSGERWHHLELRRPLDPGSGVAMIVVSEFDLTARRQAELSLAKSREQFYQLADAIPGIVWTATAEGVVDYANRALLDYAGIGNRELHDNSWLQVIHDADRERCLSAWRHAIDDETPYSVEFRIRQQQDGAYRWHLVQAVPIRDDTGRITRWYGTALDIHDRKQSEQAIEFLALYDPLTQLPNRRLLLDRLRHALAVSMRSQRMGALIFLDLDHFKTLNDTLGHHEGDVLLQQVANRLNACVRADDTVARLGGDEFVILLEGLSEHAAEATIQAKTIAEKIRAALNRPYQLAGHERHSSPSIGLALFGDQPITVEETMKQADLAMYQAKADGRNTLRLFDPDMQAAVNSRVVLESALRAGLQRGEFIPYYQPQVDVEGRLAGAETLVRWQHPQRGLLLPAEFIAVAEETGLILLLGRAMLDSVCRQLAVWAQRPDTASLMVSVNVSARQFHHPDFVAEVLEVLDRTGADPRRLQLELTESLLLQDVDDTITKMTALKAEGVGFSLDDFGTGYSSLYYLKRLPLDQLKIDQSFVRDILSDSNDAAIVCAILAMAESLGLAVIAEGVETEAVRDFLARHGCPMYQGYLFSPPLPLDRFEDFVARRATEAQGRPER